MLQNPGTENSKGRPGAANACACVGCKEEAAASSATKERRGSEGEGTSCSSDHPAPGEESGKQPADSCEKNQMCDADAVSGAAVLVPEKGGARAG